MKPRLTEHSERKSLAECDPTPSSGSLVQAEGVRCSRAARYARQRVSILLGVGFNSDKTSYVALAGSITCVLIE